MVIYSFLFYFDTVNKKRVNDLEKELHVANIALLICKLSDENLDNNLFMHSDKCKTGRLISVRIYI
jgi:hypothetical protein